MYAAGAVISRPMPQRITPAAPTTTHSRTGNAYEPLDAASRLAVSASPMLMRRSMKKYGAKPKNASTNRPGMMHSASPIPTMRP